MMNKLRLGFLLNPVAGAGGPVALKGSDALSTRDAVFSGEIISPAFARACTFFEEIKKREAQVSILCVPGPMGSDILDAVNFEYELLNCVVKRESDSIDTSNVCRALMNQGVDLIVFVGGDGTARDICETLGTQQLCLGIPAGVKMQSGVFGVHPIASAELVCALADKQSVIVELREVRDIDEAALSRGEVNSKYFGEMKVPVHDQLVQQVKQGGGELDSLVLLDIAEELKERLQDPGKNKDEEVVLVFGPGSTTQAVQHALGLEASLLGVDLFVNSESLLDVNEEQLFEMLQRHRHKKTYLILTIIGGQGHILGRGNQQLSSRVLKLIGRENICILASPHKLQQLQNRSLLIDSDDEQLNREWRGLIEVITGYRKISLHSIG